MSLHTIGPANLYSIGGIPVEIDVPDERRFWKFRCTDGKGGTIILPDPVCADQALAEIRKSIPNAETVT